MKDFFKSKGFQILVAVTLILTGLLMLRFLNTGNITESIIGFVVTPMQKITSKASDAASNIMSSKKTCEQYETEINELKKEIVNLRTLLIDYSNVKTENEQYSKYLELKKNNKSLQFAPAEVIARDPNDSFYGFTIDQGSNAGISLNDPVMTSGGLIGYVCEVEASSSHVKTILSPDIKVGAINKLTRDSGVVMGNVKLAEQNLTKLAYISAQSVMKEGDIIVTSGLSGIYPRDLQIGKVKELLNDEYDSSRYAIIEPLEDVRVVKDVSVVINFAERGKVNTQPLSEIFKDVETETSNSEAADK